MVKTVSWVQEATKFFKKYKGKNGIHTFSDALKAPALKEQYKLAKKGGADPPTDGQAINYNNDEDIEGADELSSVQYDGGNDDLVIAPALPSTETNGVNEKNQKPSKNKENIKNKQQPNLFHFRIQHTDMKSFYNPCNQTI